MPFDQALAMAGDGRISDAMTIIGLQRVALERLGAVALVQDAATVPASPPRHKP